VERDASLYAAAEMLSMHTTIPVTDIEFIVQPLH